MQKTQQNINIEPTHYIVNNLKKVNIRPKKSYPWQNKLNHCKKLTDLCASSGPESLSAEVTPTSIQTAGKLVHGLGGGSGGPGGGGAGVGGASAEEEQEVVIPAPYRKVLSHERNKTNCQRKTLL